MTTNDIMKAFVGALIGLSIPYVAKSLIYLFRRFRRARIEGTWYSYHASLIEGSIQVVSTIWKISKGFSAPFIVQIIKKMDGQLRVYAKGTLHRERNFLLINLNTTEHQEEVSIRLLDPVEPADSITWGLWMSFDYHGELFSGPQVVSRKELSDDEFKNYISNKLETDNNYKVLKAHHKKHQGRIDA